MSRGGPRPGSGRPKKEAKLNIEVPGDIRAAAKTCRLSPLEYMLGVLNDEAAAPERRDRMAQAAAPFVHAKAEAADGGKKQQRERAAETAERGTSWEALLQ